MALSLVTAAAVLFYLGAVPLHIVFRFHSDRGLTVGVAPFEARFALKRVHSLKSEKRPFPKFRHPFAILRAGKQALRHLTIEEIRVSGVFGCSDAAVTALICGGTNTLGAALHPLSRRILLNLRPDFSAAQLTADLSGMICVRVGHIIVAVLLGIIEYSAGRLKSWTDTPSKAS